MLVHFLELWKQTAQKILRLNILFILGEFLMSLSMATVCKFMFVYVGERLLHYNITNDTMGIIKQFKRHLHCACFFP